MADMYDGIADPGRLLDMERPSRCDDAPPIADLAARFGVKRGLVKQQPKLLALVEPARLDELIVVDPAEDSAFASEAEPLGAVIRRGQARDIDGDLFAALRPDWVRTRKDLPKPTVLLLVEGEVPLLRHLPG